MRRRKPELVKDAGIPAELHPGSKLWAADPEAWRQARLDWARGDRQKLLDHGTNPLEWLRETRLHRRSAVR